jgi:hypothetical protein
MRELLKSRLNFFLVIAVLALFLTYSNCGLDIEDDTRRVIGEGPIVTQTLQADTFKTFQHLAIGRVLIDTGDSLEVTISAQQNILDEMSFEFVDDTFAWGFKEQIQIQEADSITLTIKMPNEIEEILIVGVGNIMVSGEKQEQILIGVIGVVDLYAYGLEVDICELYISGNARCRLMVNEEIKGSITGVGDIYYKGEPVISVMQTGVVNIYNDN